VGVSTFVADAETATLGAVVTTSTDRPSGPRSVTEIVDIPKRSHALTIDGGWREIVDKALAFVKQSV
jgi:non-heme chloroperoxidase